MGRSVETRHDALIEVYTEWGDFEDWAERQREYLTDMYGEEDVTEDELYDDWINFGAEDDWLAYKENLIYRVQELWPSFWEDLSQPSAYYLRETSVYLRNQWVEISVSEYCGLTYIAVAPVDPDNTNLARGFAKAIEKKFHAEFGQYQKAGTFSNGESVYVAQ